MSMLTSRINGVSAQDKAIEAAFNDIRNGVDINRVVSTLKRQGVQVSDGLYMQFKAIINKQMVNNRFSHNGMWKD